QNETASPAGVFGPGPTGAGLSAACGTQLEGTGDTAGYPLANAVPEPLLAVVFGAVIPVAYLAGVVDLARLRRGDQFRSRQELVYLDFPWLSSLLSPRRTRPFSSPVTAQFWLEWREGGVALPFCWVGLQALALSVVLTWFILMQLFPQMKDDTE